MPGAGQAGLEDGQPGVQGTEEEGQPAPAPQLHAISRYLPQRKELWRAGESRVEVLSTTNRLSIWLGKPSFLQEAFSASGKVEFPDSGLLKSHRDATSLSALVLWKSELPPSPVTGLGLGLAHL